MHLPGAGSPAGVIRPLIADGPAAPSHLVFRLDSPARNLPTLSCTAAPAAQAQIASGLLSRPAPYRLIGIEVRAVARQVHQSQPQARRPRQLRIASPRCAGALSQITFGGPERLRRNRAKKAAGFRRCCCPPVHPFHLARLQAHRRIVALLATPRAAGVHQGAPLPAATCPAVQHLPGSGPRRQRISFPQCAQPRPAGRRTQPRSLTSPLASLALTRRFLGRSKANPAGYR